MNLERCRILGFGKLGDLALHFREGLNLVFARNEGGKSTLQRYLVAMLYGQLRADLRFQRRLEAWVEQYKPWRSDAYGGILWLRLQNGREIEIHRSFGKDETRIEIRTATGEIITGEYEQQKNGDVLLARKHLELPKDLFESIAVIKESRLTELSGRDSIRDRVTNLAQSGAEELSIRQSLDRLKEALDCIGSDRAPTKPYAQAVVQLASLQAEKAALAARRDEYQNWVLEKSRLAEEVAQLEREQAAVKMLVLTTRFREADTRLRALGELDNELNSLRGEIDNLRAYASFPVHALEELNQLSGACNSTETSLSEVGLRLQALDEQLRRAEEERRKVEAYSSVDAEKISDWFVHYLSLTVKRDEAQKSASQYLEETGIVEKGLERLSAALRNPEVDWQRTAREAAEEERTASEKGSQLGEKITNLKAQLSQARTRAVRLLLLGCAAVLLGLASFAAAPVVLAMVILAVLVAAAAAFFAMSARMKPKLEQTSRVIRSLIAEQVRVLEAGREVQRGLEKAVRESGFSSLEEFLSAGKQAELHRQRFADLLARKADKEQQRERLQSECSEVFSSIAAALAPIGLSCSPGNIKNQIDAMRSGVRRFRDHDASCRGLVEQSSSLRTEQARLTKELAEKKFRIQVILSGAVVETPEEFRECCRRSLRVNELMEKEASRAREFQRLCGDLTIDGWRQRREELNDSLHQAAGSAPTPSDTPTPGAGDTESERSPYLPYLPGVEEVEREENQALARLAAARENSARTVERLSQAFQGFRPMSEIEEDIALTDRSLSELSVNREALQTAIDTIQTLSREEQEVLAPQLNSSVEQRFLRLCGCRYDEVRIDPEFNIYAREVRTGELRAAEFLSRGTQDQLYFALRFGILDLVSSQNEPCPCLLDEPFSAYDRERIQEAFRILQEEAGRRQLFVFTCREDLRNLAEAQHAHVIALPENQ